VIVGDDVNITVHPFFHRWFNPQTIRACSSRIDMQYTFEYDEFVEYSELTFLGHKPLMSRIPGFDIFMWLPTIDCQKMRTSMLRDNERGGVANTIIRACGLRNETFACQDCRRWFADLIDYLRQHYSRDLDDDIRNAFTGWKSDYELWCLYTGIQLSGSRGNEAATQRKFSSPFTILQSLNLSTSKLPIMGGFAEHASAGSAPDYSNVKHIGSRDVNRSRRQRRNKRPKLSEPTLPTFKHVKEVVKGTPIDPSLSRQAEDDLSAVIRNSNYLTELDARRRDNPTLRSDPVFSMDYYDAINKSSSLNDKYQKDYSALQQAKFKSEDKVSEKDVPNIDTGYTLAAQRHFGSVLSNKKRNKLAHSKNGNMAGGTGRKKGKNKGSKKKVELLVPSKSVSSKKKKVIEKMVMAPTNSGHVIVSQPQRLKSGKHRQIISGTDTCFFLPKTTVFTPLAYPVIPSSTTLFPRLNQQVLMYDEYRWNKCVFHYDTSCGANETGDVIMAFEYDVTEAAPTDAITLLGYEGSKQISPWVSGSIGIKKRNIVYPKYFTTDITSSPLSVTDTGARTQIPGVFIVATQNQSTTGNAGRIWVEYELEVFGGQIPVVPQNQRTFRAAGTTIGSSSDPMGSLSVMQNNTGVFGNPVNDAANTRVQFPIYRSGRYLVFYTVKHSAASGMPYNVTVTSNGTGVIVANSNSPPYQQNYASTDSYYTNYFDISGVNGYSTLNYVTINFVWTGNTTSPNGVRLTVVGLSPNVTGEHEDEPIWGMGDIRFAQPWWNCPAPKLVVQTDEERKLKYDLEVAEAKLAWAMSALGGRMAGDESPFITVDETKVAADPRYMRFSRTPRPT
jgi:hypothetical protein